MKALLALLFLAPLAAAQIGSVTLPHVFAVDSTPRVRYVHENDTVMANRVNQLKDTVNALQAGTAALSGLTASLPVFTNSLKRPVSNAMTGTGSVVMSTSPTLTTPTFSGNITLGGDYVFSSTTHVIRGNTSDGADNQRILFGAGGVVGSVTRGAFANLNGNENSGDPGDALIAAGEAGDFRVATGASQTDRLTITAGGGATFSGTVNVTSTVTADSLISSKFYTEDSWTATLTGVSGTVTGTARYVRIGKQVTLMLPYLAGTSNSTSCTITGMPAAIRPARKVSFTETLMDNGGGTASALTGFEIETSGTLTFYLGGSATGFTGSGVKGFPASVNGTPAQTEYKAYTYTIQ